MNRVVNVLFSYKAKDFFDKLGNYQFFKEDSSACSCYVSATLLV